MMELVEELESMCLVTVKVKELAMVWAQAMVAA
jgi:hypothetical protein